MVTEGWTPRRVHRFDYKIIIRRGIIHGLLPFRWRRTGQSEHKRNERLCLLSRKTTEVEGDCSRPVGGSRKSDRKRGPWGRNEWPNLTVSASVLTHGRQGKFGPEQRRRTYNCECGMSRSGERGAFAFMAEEAGEVLTRAVEGGGRAVGRRRVPEQ